MSMPSPQAEKRLCPLCLTTKRIDQFRPHKTKAGRCYRAPHCNACHCQREKERLAGKKREADAKLLHAAWGSLARPETKRMCVEKFLLSLMQKFGGPDELAKQWHQCFIEATAMKRVRAALAMIRLLEWFQRHDVDLAAMTDDQLANEAASARASAFVEMLRSDPQAAADLARRSGYVLEPVGQLDRSEA